MTTIILLFLSHVVNSAFDTEEEFLVIEGSSSGGKYEEVNSNKSRDIELSESDERWARDRVRRAPYRPYQSKKVKHILC